MNINSAFPSNFLKAADLQGRRIGVVIKEVAMEDIGGEDKPVVYFEGKDKGLVLNKTNANMIIEIIKSSETDDWTGAKIALYPTRVDFQGRRVDAIRVDYVPDGNGGKKTPALKQQSPVQPEDAGFDGSDDVPF